MHIVTKKTRTEAVLPLSDEALTLCGERSTGQVFKGMTQALLPLYLKDWIRSAGITKHITFKTYYFLLLIENKKLTKVVSLTGNDLETSGLLYSAMFCINQKNASLICKSSVFLPHCQNYSSEK